jgi:hypothetical protein
MYIFFILFIFMGSILAFSQTWEQYVDGQIKHQQDMELEQKKIEVLARMQRMSAPIVSVDNSNSVVTKQEEYIKHDYRKP